MHQTALMRNIALLSMALAFLLLGAVSPAQAQAQAAEGQRQRVSGRGSETFDFSKRLRHLLVVGIEPLFESGARSKTLVLRDTEEGWKFSVRFVPPIVRERNTR